MGFTDFASEPGSYLLEGWLSSRSYISGSQPSQADVTVFKAFKAAPEGDKYPHVFRWYKHINSYSSEFAKLPGDASKDISTYGPGTKEVTSSKAPEAAAAAEEDDDEVDLFGSDDEEEDAAAAKVREDRLEEYRKKKEGKVKPAAKSIVTLDIKPWDDETNMEELTANVKKITKDGLTWGGHKLVPVGFGIKKLQINVVIEDDKVGVDDLQQEIEEDEDHVQSTDVAAMQKL